MSAYLELFLVVLAVNLMPAFGPPTWSVLVLYKLTEGIAPVPLVLAGALAAALGRFILAKASSYVVPWLPERTKHNLEGAKATLESHSTSTWLGLGLFALSPVPSAQLFEAAGLAKVRLLPFTGAFFAGRLVSYSFYVLAATQAEKHGLADEFVAVLKSPAGIAVEAVMLALLVVFTQIDWHRIGAALHHRQ